MPEGFHPHWLVVVKMTTTISLPLTVLCSKFILVRYVLAFSCSSFRLMQACVDVAFPYAHVRDAFGKKIGEHQVNNSHLVLFHHFVDGLCFSMILPIIFLCRTTSKLMFPFTFSLSKLKWPTCTLAWVLAEVMCIQ